MMEFELVDILEPVSIRNMDKVIAKYTKEAIVEQLGFEDDVSVVVLPCDHSTRYEDGFFHDDAPVEVFAPDGNTILAKGRVHASFTVLDETVFEDYDIEGLELMYIDGHLVEEF